MMMQAVFVCVFDVVGAERFVCVDECSTGMGGYSNGKQYDA